MDYRKYILIGLLLIPLGAVAINVSIPQATQYGQIPAGLSTGNYTPVATSTLGLPTFTYLLDTLTWHIVGGKLTPTSTIDILASQNMEVPAGSYYKYNGTNLAFASTTKFNYFFGDAGNLTATGRYNVGSGYWTLHDLTSGEGNTGVGYQALRRMTTSDGNVAVGRYAMREGVTGTNNVALGSYALRYNDGGSRNIGIGYNSMNGNTTGNDNQAIGDSALTSNSTGYQNAAIGSWALILNEDGYNNTSIGYYSMQKNISGHSNVGIGYKAGDKSTGDGNTYIGFEAGAQAVGDNNIFVGIGADIALTSSSSDNVVVIGNNVEADCENCLILGGANGSGQAVKVGIGTTTPNTGFGLTVASTTALMGYTHIGSSVVSVPIYDNYLLDIEGDLDSYLSTTMINTNAGTAASADFIMNNDEDESLSYFDIGYGSSNYTDNAVSPGENYQGYIFNSLGPISLMTAEDQPITFHTEYEDRVQIDGDGLTVYGTSTLATTTMAFDSQIGDGSTYMAVEEWDWNGGVVGSVPLIRFVSPTFAQGDYWGGIANGLVIQEVEATQNPAILFVSGSLSSVNIEFATTTNYMNFKNADRYTFDDDVSIDGNATVTDSFFIGGNTQPYKMETFDAGVPDGFISLQGQTSGANVSFGLATKDSDGTDKVSLAILGVGEFDDFTNNEILAVGWNPSNSLYNIYTNAAGTGVIRDLDIYTGANNGQIYLASDGNTLIPNLFSTTTLMDYASTTQLEVTGLTDLATTTMTWADATLDFEAWNVDVGGPVVQIPIIHGLGATAIANINVQALQGITMIREGDYNATFDYSGNPQLSFTSTDFSSQAEIKFATTTGRLSFDADGGLYFDDYATTTKGLWVGDSGTPTYIDLSDDLFVKDDAEVAGDLWVIGDLTLGGITNSFLSADGLGKIIATTSPVLTETDPVWTSEKASYLTLTDWFGTTTDQLTEGSNNLYYTQARVWDDTWASTTLATTLNEVNASSTLWNTGYLLANAGHTNWDTAYTDRLKWDGGSTGLVAATGRASLELGTIATQAANSVSITGGSITGITDLTVADGGTGASTLTGLLQGNGTSAITAITGTAGQIPYYNDTNTLLATSTLFISTGGNVGIGTDSPGDYLNIVKSHNVASGIAGITLNNTANSWNRGMGMTFSVAGVGTVGSISGFRGLGGITGLSNGESVLDYRSDHHRFTNSAGTEFMRIESNGNVGIGTVSPQQLLHVNTAADAAAYAKFTNSDSGSASGDGFDVGYSSGNYAVLVNRENTAIKFYTAGTERLSIGNDGSLTDAAVYSDTVGGTRRDLYIDNTGRLGYVSSAKKYKENIRVVDDASWIYDLTPRIYDRKDGSTKNEIGLIADEVVSVYPQIVSFSQDEPETVNYGSSNLIVSILKEVQNLRSELDKIWQGLIRLVDWNREQDQRIKDLEQQVVELQAKLEKL